MTYGDIYEKAKAIIGEENIVDYRPAIIGDSDQVIYAVVHTAITIWLKNGDVKDCPCSYMVRTGDYEGMMICNAREFRDTQSGFREELSKYFVVVDAPERPKDCPIRIVKEDKHD